MSLPSIASITPRSSPRSCAAPSCPRQPADGRPRRGAGYRPAFVLLLLAACAGPGAQPEAHSLLGKPLWPSPLAPADRTRLERELGDAARQLEEHPEEEDAWIWKGRRLAYLGHYRDAIDTFSQGLALLPDSFRLLRHRGHRLLTVRRVPDAIADLERAAVLIEGIPDEIEPDGIPNSRGIPRSTSHSNIFYHLGLAHYVAGDFAAAVEDYRRGMPFAAVNDDMRLAMACWLYLSLRHAGREAEAEELLAASAGPVELLEDPSYDALLRLFRGELRSFEVLDPAEPGSVAYCTRAYGVACWHLFKGESAVAEELWRRILESPQWPAFGYLAAEAELARLESRDPAP